MSNTKPTYEELEKRVLELQERLAKTQWLNEKENTSETKPYIPFYGNVIELNTKRTILDNVGKDNLQNLTSELMDLLDTSVAIYEKNGDYAHGKFNSGWCQLMDASSRKLCNTDDNKTALNCGKWLCHEDCWNNSANAAIISKKATDINCVGGIKLYGEPIFVGDEVVGVINIGYGNPPTSDNELIELSEKFNIDFETLKEKAIAYKPRPRFIIEIAKKRMKSIAKLLGQIINGKLSEEIIKESEQRFLLAMKASNDGLFDWNLETNAIYYSPGWKKMLGYEDHELPNDFSIWETNTDAEDVKKSWELQQKLITKQIDRFVMEFKMKHKDGHWVDILSRSEAIFNENNKAVRIVGTHTDITERKQGEEKLKESEEKFRQLFEGANDAIFLADAETGKIIDANKQAEKLVGRKTSEIIGMHQNQLHPSAEENKAKTSFKEDISLGDTTVMKNFHVQHKNGLQIPVEISPSIIEINGKKYVLSTFRDIADRKKAEQALKDSEERFKLAMDTTNEGIWDWDIIKNTVYYNYGWFNILGISDFDFSFQTWENRIHEDDKNEVIRLLNSHLEGKIEIWQKEHRLLTENGNIKWVLGRGKVVKRKPDGTPCRMVGTMTDITARKKAELKLQENEQILEEAQKIAHLGSFQYIAATKTTSWSAEEYRIYGLNPNDSSPEYEKMLRECIHPEDADLLHEIFTKAMQSQTSYELEHRIVHPDGSVRWVYDKAQPYLNEQGELERYVGVTLDITDRKKAEELLLRTSKLESIGTLAGGISHDFNNLLSSIYGNIELARNKSSEDKVINHLNRTIDSLERATGLTNQLLTFSKGGEPIKKVEEVGKIIENTVNFALSGSKATSKIAIKDDLHKCMIDKNQIMQVIDNLIINSKQAMPTGGTVSVSASNILLDTDEIWDLDTGEYVKMEIEDTGVGISEEDLPKIFDPFFSTKPTGHGIGLSAAYSIIQKHGGTIDVESTLGEGTKFAIYLPATDESKEEIKVEYPINHSGKGTFIVMDDEESVREVVGEMLETFGYDVVLKNNGEETIEFFKGELSEGREVAGMLFDLTIPSAMGGQETIVEIRKLCKKTKVFVASGYTDSAIMSKPKEYGFNGTLKKPFGLQEIMDLLNKHMS